MSYFIFRVKALIRSYDSFSEELNELKNLDRIDFTSSAISVEILPPLGNTVHLKLNKDLREKLKEVISSRIMKIKNQLIEIQLELKSLGEN